MPVEIPLCGKDEGKYFTCSEEDAKLALSDRWYLSSNGYVTNNRWEHFHVLIGGSAAAKGLVWDHIDGNRLNNCRNNLRMITNGQNMFDMPKSNNRSGVTGVCYDKTRKRWMAYICVEGKRKCLGRFETFEVAVKVRETAVMEALRCQTGWLNSDN